MYPGIHNFSEIGKLNKVLLHRPGEELESLTPATLERLLFDDIPYLKVAQEEHDRFAEVLRENGVEVIYYVDEVAKAIANPARQIQLVNDFLNISKIHAKGLRASMTTTFSKAVTFCPKIMPDSSESNQEYWRCFS